MKRKSFLGRCFAAMLSGMMVLLSVFLSCGNSIPAMAAFINQGANIPYDRYLPGATYSTHYYTVDGKAAYCIESEKSAVPNGDYSGSSIAYSAAPMLILALHYGPGGDGNWQMKKYFLEEKGMDLSDEQMYLYTHIVANYAYVGANMSSTPGQFYKGLNSDIAESSGINDWIRFLARVLAGAPDYTGGQVINGYAQVYTTSSQKIAMVGSVEYAYPAPPVDAPKRGKISVTKTGPVLSGYEDGNFVWEEKGLTGAEFKVFAADQIVEKETVIYEKDAEAGSIVTGEDGCGSLENLPMGTYYLVETKAPAGYVLNADPVPVTLSEDLEENNVILQTLSLHNEKKKIAIQLQKSDNANSNPLKGASFGLYAAEDITLPTGEVLVAKDTLLKEAVSDENGKIDFAMDLPLFSYSVKELGAPYGYVLSGEDFTFTPADYTETENTYKISHTFANNAVKGKAVFTKKGESLVAFEDGNFKYEERALSGAEFDLYSGETLLTHATSDENGQISFTDLPLGSYTLKETKAPYGMLLDETPVEFEIKYQDQNTPVVLYTDSLVNQRKKVSLMVEKRDAYTKIPLSGGKFDLYATDDILNCDGDVIVEKDTVIKSVASKDGVVDFELDLPYGAYYVKESEALHGYQKTDEVFKAEFVYNPDDDTMPIVSIMIYNTPVPTPSIPPERPKKVAGRNYVTEDAMTGEYSALISEGMTATAFAGADSDEVTDATAMRYLKAGIFTTAAMVFSILSAVILFIRKKEK